MEPPIRQIERIERNRRRLPALFGVGVIVVAAATWVGLFGFLSVNTAYGAAVGLGDKYLCDTSAIDLSFPDLTRLSSVYSQDGVFLGDLTERNSQPVSLDDMPALVRAALLSAEDKSFYEHEGIDFSAIGRAVFSRAIGTPSGGGSTITQQVVKQNFYTSEQTIERKLCESVIAAELEEKYTKDQILEFWANSVYFGSNAYGIRAAGQEYFDKELQDLTLAEAALLPIPIRNPTFYHPRFNAENAVAARNRTIDRMVANGYILPIDAWNAKSEPIGVVPNEEVVDTTPQVMLRVIDKLLNDRANTFGLGETEGQRRLSVFGCPASETDCDGGGGLKIDITVNDRLQTEANRILRAWFRTELGGPTGAISTIDNTTGAIRVMATGLDFGDDIEAGQRQYDLATGGKGRQTGSAFKPITLAAALQYGDASGNPITLGSYWDDSSPARIPCDPSANCENNIWPVNNFSGNKGHDLQTLDEASYRSTNAVYARVVSAIGPERVVEMATILGITSKLVPHLSITLGAQEVVVEDLASAYSTLANFGTFREPYLIERITDAEGNIVYEHEDDPRQVLNSQIAAAVVGSMKKVVSSAGTARRADIGRPQAGKTGTTTNSADLWFSGFIPQMTTAIWVGYGDTNSPLEDFTVFNDLTGEEQFIQSGTGGKLAAPIWKQFMEYATEGMPVLDFPPDPPGTDIYRQTPFTVVPLPGQSTKSTIDDIYAVGLRTEIEEIPSTLPQGTFIETLPLPGTRLRQGSTVIVQVSSGIAPDVAFVDLRGLKPSQIPAALAAFRELTGISVTWALIEVTAPNPSLDGIVVSTNPAPGSPVNPGDTIEVMVGKAP